jgi:serine phosphatase RsbU (regulator of sigma subunit)
LPALILRSNGAIKKLHSTCTVMGLFEDLDCCIEECELFPGDLLALYTDGVTESFNESGEDFGEQGLIEQLRRCGTLNAQAVIDSIIAAVRKFSPGEQSDDITAIAARCR